jgi:hypothetical protein
MNKYDRSKKRYLNFIYLGLLITFFNKMII